MMIKVLVSTGYGAGWSTWASSKQKEIATYQPIIDFIENGGDPSELHVPYDFQKKETEQPPQHPLVQQMIDELELEDFYTGGASRLKVRYCYGPFFVREYDGHETLHTESSFW